MSKLFYSLFFVAFLCHSANAQCDGNRYRNMIFTDVDVTSDMEYGSNIDFQGTETTLLLDIYEPSGDTEVDRPLIIMVHGGSFISGSKTGTDVVPLCQDLAKMGYVCASINYRLGIPITLNLQEPATEAVLRGVHDFKAAVRYFRKNVEEDGNSWNIDPDQIYAAGVSAGGFVTVHSAYLDEESEIPEYLNLDQEGLTGGLEGESGNAGYSSEVAGIVNIAGAIADTSWIQPGDEPILSFHGTGDTVVPFDSEMLQMFGTFDVMEVDGSNSIHQKAEEVGLTECFEIYWMEGHVPHVDNTQYYDTTRSIISNFFSHLVCPEIDLDCEYREINIIVDVEDVPDFPVLTAYPNPTSERLFFDQQLASGLEVNVYNLSGALVKSTQIESDNSIDCRDLPRGMYVGHVVLGEGVSRFRVVVE